MFNLILKNLVIKALLFLKNFKPFQSIGLVIGTVTIQHKSALTGKIKTSTFRHLLAPILAYNAMQTAVHYAVASLISTTGNAKWIGTNGLATQDQLTLCDGIYINVLTAIKAMATVKYAGGTGAENYVTFRGTYTEPTGFTPAGFNIGIGATPPSTSMTSYATQTYITTINAGDTIIVDWKLEWN